MQKQPKTYSELFDRCWQPHDFSRNLLIGDPTTKAGQADQWPSENFFAASTESVKFKSGEEYPALADGSQFKAKAANGRDPGADIPMVLAAISGVREGVPGQGR